MGDSLPFPRLVPSYLLGLSPDVTSTRKLSLIALPKSGALCHFLPVASPCFPLVPLTLILLICTLV